MTNTPPSTIHYVKRQDIDTKRWDACVQISANGLIYARSWWLDTMADNWDALILGDYIAIMPLPWKKKYGIRYLYQPPLTQQLGVISFQHLGEPIIAKFIEKAKAHFRFAEITLNSLFDTGLPHNRNNFYIPLGKHYHEIAAGYSTSLKTSLKRAANRNLSYKQLHRVTDIIELFKLTYQDRDFVSDPYIYERLKKVAGIAIEKNMWLTRYVTRDNDNQDLQDICTGALCPIDEKRIYFILSVTPKDKRTYMPNHFLIDRLIHQFSSSHLLLDFEGSDLPGVATFNQSFGTRNEPYHFLKWNNLPWPISMLKK